MRGFWWVAKGVGYRFGDWVCFGWFLCFVFVYRVFLFCCVRCGSWCMVRLGDFDLIALGLLGVCGFRV